MGRARIDAVPVIGIDERAFRKGHRYLKLVYDHQCSRVLYVADERKEARLAGFGRCLASIIGPASREAISMDMREPFINSVRAHVPDADTKIVFEKYHIVPVARLSQQGANV